jgi:hypothetical protein
MTKKKKTTEKDDGIQFESGLDVGARPMIELARVGVLDPAWTDTDLPPPKDYDEGDQVALGAYYHKDPAIRTFGHLVDVAPARARATLKETFSVLWAGGEALGWYLYRETGKQTWPFVPDLPPLPRGPAAEPWYRLATFEHASSFEQALGLFGCFASARYREWLRDAFPDVVAQEGK